MNEIKFSHVYPKLISGLSLNKDVPIEEAMLRAVIRVDRSVLNEAFLNYDTTIRVTIDQYGRSVTDRYRLPEGELLLLLFTETISGTPFTTLRRYTSQKELYYKRKIGEVFKVIIKKE